MSYNARRSSQTIPSHFCPSRCEYQCPRSPSEPALAVPSLWNELEKVPAISSRRALGVASVRIFGEGARSYEIPRGAFDSFRAQPPWTHAG